jgi:hypothetical protein
MAGGTKYFALQVPLKFATPRTGLLVFQVTIAQLPLIAKIKYQRQVGAAPQCCADEHRRKGWTGGHNRIVLRSSQQTPPVSNGGDGPEYLRVGLQDAAGEFADPLSQLLL